MKISVAGHPLPFSDTNNPNFAKNGQKVPYLTGLSLPTGWVEKWRQN